jgi:peptidoglycan/LPS O-acetylase OafA/YrhL
MGSKDDRFLALDSVRGLCACYVALAHFWTASPLTGSVLWQNSYLCVDFFFVLSGFVICWNYQGRLGSLVELRRFAILRLGRLYPLHVTVLAAFVAIESLAFYAYPHLLGREPFHGSTSPDSLLGNLLLIHSLNVYDDLTWNGPSWSISAEIWAYAVFALVCLSGRLSTFLFIASVPLLFGIVLGAPHGMGSTFDYGFPRCLLGFFTGVLCCKFYAGFAPRLSGRLCTLAELAILVAVVLLFTGVLTPFLAVPVMAAAVIACAREGGRATRVLRWAPLIALGRLSYSIYMVHWLMISLFKLATNELRNKFALDLWGALKMDGQAVHVFGRNPLEGAVFLLAFLAATLALSVLTYKFIEQPGRAWSRRYAAQSSTPDTVVAEPGRSAAPSRR